MTSWHWKPQAGKAGRERRRAAGKKSQTSLPGAVSALARQRKAQIVRLCIDANAVAALVLLRSGDMAWCWKIAHDEAYARFSPGVQVLLEATEQLLADEGISRVDSCATADHPMIDHIWRERLRVADCMFAIAPDGPRAFAAVRTAEAARRALITCIKKVRQRFGKS
jgi:Acetyltransferase (GNAT) domain